MGWSQDLVPERWKRRTESQTTGERPTLRKQKCYRNISLSVSSLLPFFLPFHIRVCMCAYYKNTTVLIQALTPLLFSRVLLMLHPPLDVFSR